MNPKDNDELREEILLQGEVSFDTYDKDSRTARKLVKIPIDDLMHLISTYVMRAREEQVVQDFISLTAAYLPEVDESELIEWREDQLAHLKSQRKEDNHEAKK